jgi:hypothetical protein
MLAGVSVARDLKASDGIQDRQKKQFETVVILESDHLFKLEQLEALTAFTMLVVFTTS